MDINNSVVVITSAGSPLGQHLTQHFLNLNAHVILIDHHEADLQRTMQYSLSHSSRIFRYTLNQYDEKSIQLLFSSIHYHFHQGIDALINLYPHLPSPSLINDGDAQEYSENIGMISTSILHFTKLATQQMLEKNKQGVIVNLSCEQNDTVYSASSLILDFTKSWAKELTPFKIRVGGILPNWDLMNEQESNWLQVYDGLIRNTEYIIENDFFNGRVLHAY